jgi:hypothetical protein
MTINDPYNRSTEVVVEPQAVTYQPAVENVVAVPTGTRVRRASSSHFEPDAIIAALVGLVLLVVGLIAITRAGFDGEMSDPVVQVLGFTHTTTLGLIEIAFGICLLIAGASRSRPGALFFGTVLGVAGFVGAVQTESFTESLALESSMAWLVVIAGVVVVLSALMMPRFARRSTVIESV